MLNWILRLIYKICFSLFLSRFKRVWLKKFAKSADMTKKNCFQIIFIWVSKNADFDAEFESVEKVAKKLTQRKLQGWELLYTVPKDEKVHNSYTFMLITFFNEIFLQFFQWIQNQHQILHFLIPILK